MPFRLRISRSLYDQITSHAVSECPNECCGLVAGRRKPEACDASEVPVFWGARIFPLVNAAASPVEYLSEPRSMFEAVREMQKLELDVLAVYHSHPLSDPVPSRTDLERNYSAEVQNLIISLKLPSPFMRAWWLDENGFRQALCEVIEL
jgi:proteasome lid subunit RPN8/RPN11